MNENLEIFKQADTEAATAEAGEYLNNFLIENIKQPVLLLVSGGSAFNILCYVGKHALGENLTVSVLDERFSQDPLVNNFAQLQKLDFYQDALDAEASFFGTLPRPNETMEELRIRWDKNLKLWRDENQHGIIAATLGMGAEGHTAGIFPNADENKFEQMFTGNAWTAAYNAGDVAKFPERVTTTITFLKTIAFAFALVCGNEKKQKFEELVSANQKISNLPAQTWHQMKNVKVFTDLEI